MIENSVILRLYRDHIRQYHRYLIFSLLCMVAAALSTAALPKLLKDVFDDVFQSHDPYRLFIFCLTVFAAFFIKGASSYGESVTLTYVGQKIISDIQNRLFRHLMTLDLAFFHNTTSGELLSRFTNDVQLMRQAFSSTTLNIGKDSVTLIALVIYMFITDPVLASISFFVFPSAIYPILKMGRRMRKVSYNTQEHMGDFTTQMGQIFQSIRVVKAYHSEAIESKLIESTIKKLFNMIYKAARIRCAAHPITETLGGLAVITVIAYGGWQVSQSERTTGDFISFILAFLLAYDPLKKLSNLNANLQEGLSAAERLFELLDLSPSIVSKENALVLKEINTDIEFKDVTFSYIKDEVTLDHLTFSIPVSKTTAFVGPSGAGKSTIINLIPRFYDINSGSILINNNNLKDYDIDSLRSCVALVSQEVALFDRSIFDNIAYGKQGASEEDVIHAAKMANAHEFISNLKEGYETLVGENGVKLSGGQRQRIAIARAMLKNAPVLLLDEATSALDTDSERYVQSALKSLMEGRTTIMVAHRLSTVVDADLIYVLDKGKIIEQGTHQELLQYDGMYARLWRKQLETDVE